MYFKCLFMWNTRIFPRFADSESEEVIVECDWYEKVGIYPRTKLIQVRRNNNFDACRVQFLKNLYPHNLVMWPSVASAPDNGLLDVIYHHQ